MNFVVYQKSPHENLTSSFFLLKWLEMMKSHLNLLNPNHLSPRHIDQEPSSSSKLRAYISARAKELPGPVNGTTLSPTRHKENSKRSGELNLRALARLCSSMSRSPSETAGRDAQEMAKPTVTELQRAETLSSAASTRRGSPVKHESSIFTNEDDLKRYREMLAAWARGRSLDELYQWYGTFRQQCLLSAGALQAATARGIASEIQLAERDCLEKTQQLQE